MRVMSLSRSPETESAECVDVIGVNDGLRDRKKTDGRKTGSRRSSLRESSESISVKLKPHICHTSSQIDRDILHANLAFLASGRCRGKAQRGSRMMRN